MVVYAHQSQSSSSSHPTVLFDVCTFVLYVCVSIYALQIGSPILLFWYTHSIKKKILVTGWLCHFNTNDCGLWQRFIMWRWVCSENRKKYVLWLGLTKKGKTVWKASPEGSTSQIPSLMGNCRWASGFPGGSVVKKPTYQCRSHRRQEFDPRVGKIPGGGKGNRLQYSCLGNPMDRGAWRAKGHGVKKSGIQLSNWAGR